jgi:hypothetical protein
MVPQKHPGTPAERLVNVGRVGKKQPTYRAVDWCELLEDKAVLTFDLPVDAATLLQRAGGPRAALPPLRAVFANFGTNGGFRSFPREEYYFALSRIPRISARALGPKLGPRPYLSHRVSPLADLKRPLPEEDILPARAEGPFPVDPSITTPTGLPSSWTSGAWQGDWVQSYPDQRVAQLALQALTTGLSPFVGDIAKAVDQVQRTPKANTAIEIRKAIMKEVALGRTAGPFPTSAFAATRIVPNGLVPKDKYDEGSDRVRITCDPSAVHPGFIRGSINDLTWSPELLSSHLSPARIRDTLAWMFHLYGPGIEVWSGDVPSCFRQMQLHELLLALFTYRVQTEEFGTEFFTELCTPFGWTASEWGWQCVLGLVLWYALLEGFPDLEAYVDNFFLFSHPAAGQDHSARSKRIEGVFAALGVPLHERMEGQFFKGLGWYWDLSPAQGPPQMVCAEDKFAYVCRKLAKWATATHLRIKDVEKLVGLLRWLSAGFPVGRSRSHLAFVIHDLTKFKRLARGSSSRAPVWAQTFQISVPSRSAVAFWHKTFNFPAGTNVSTFSLRSAP